MRIFLAGATGVLGGRLVPLLIAAGYQVAGMTRSADKAAGLRAAGAEPVVCDVYDGAALTDAVVAYAPDLVMHQLTDLPDDPARIAEGRGANARIRVEGTRNLLAAAAAAGAPRVIAQSVAWELGGEGQRAAEFLEESVLAADGVVLRYGQFYGPGTYYPDGMPDDPRIHIDEAAARTLLALDLTPGVYRLVDGAARDIEPAE
ncbi:Putative NADH-flavin reductase [Nocardia otitidiscaviarum]|uniref:NAD-dependent epimerase/dehydratase family protein n=1 Tax=Nocardia otitidiscaviarum TaxID=1823 RepID=A0A378YJS1_9NOCA|nr:NAD(P)-dependent oxidoreductase [Nocardia otitidiscaviarum]MCP9620628.1 NAD-dependent epimerase/dehydratase family protein [Nocardia otitidiscaviarum]QDP81449.1 NAD-dependent epimerase/dehydratase family protein [Nocardia otitidiscaviarum]SUA77445.1 Putative NADH-flavin reductase [Nocardia otitidiscaviarum]